MKYALLVVSVFALLLGIAALVAHRYEYMTPESPFVYRVDRWTGDVEEWQRGFWVRKL